MVSAEVATALPVEVPLWVELAMELVAWLRELNLDPGSIEILAKHQKFTKNDLLEIVTREDLVSAGLK